MIKRKLFLLFALIFHFELSVVGQNKPSEMLRNDLYLGTVIADSLFENRNLSDQLGMAHIFESKNPIEIRLYSGLSTSKPECIILCYSDSSRTWNGSKRMFDMEKLKLSTVVINKKIFPLDSIFSTLVSNNVFSLPTQAKINHTKYYLDLEKKEMYLLDVSVFDGICYFLEFKILGDFRQYKYCNPVAYYEALPNSSELKKFINILVTLNDITKK